MAAPITDWSICTKRSTIVQGHAPRPCTQLDIDWPEGGAIANSWNRQLWTGISHAPLVLESWDFVQTCHSSRGTTLPQEPITSGYLDFPPFLILWKTLKMYLLLGIFTNLHETRYVQSLDQCLQKLFLGIFVHQKLKPLRANENCSGRGFSEKVCHFLRNLASC